MTKQEIINYMYENHVQGDFKIEEMAEDLAQTETHDKRTETHTCDFISRQDAINALTENKEMINAVLDSLTLDYNTRRNQEQRRGQIDEDIETIKALQPVRPKVGHWIKIKYAEEVNEMLVSNYECSECHCWERYESDFCPDCGANMRGEKR